MLREFKAEDAQAVFGIFSQDSVTRTLNSDVMQSIEEAEKKVSIRKEMFEVNRGIRWAIEPVRNDDTIIGSCGYYLLNRDSYSCEIGYELHPRYWRQGIMTEALTAIINFGYSDSFFFNLNRIQALTYIESENSKGLLKKLGFREEGILRDYAYWKDEFHDLVCFSLLRREWAPNAVFNRSI